MKKNVFGRAILTATLLITVCATGSIVIGGAGGPLEDRVDAAIISGKLLPAAMLGAPISKYRLFASDGTNLAPIPFQIDERNDKGVLLMQKGPKVAPDNDNGAFDANDELVFMAFDASTRLAGKPAVAGCETFAEISMTDEKTSAVGYAYLAKCANPPPMSSKRYVQWDTAKRTAVTDRYKMGWQLGAVPNYNYDYLSIFGSPDLLDRLKVRVAVGIGALRKVFNEGDFKNAIAGTIEGPVRVVYTNNSKLGLGLLGGIPIGQDVYFYRDWAYLYNPIDSRFNPAVIGLDFEVGIIHDLALDRSKGYKLCADVLPNCIAIDGKMTPEKAEMAKKELHWGGIVGPEGAIMTRLIMDKRLPTKSMGVYVDDDKVTNKPENIPGSSPEIGFLVVQWKGAKAGVYTLDFYHYFMKKFSKAEMDRFDRIVYNPLKIKTVALQ